MVQSTLKLNINSLPLLVVNRVVEKTGTQPEIFLLEGSKSQRVLYKKSESQRMTSQL